MSERERREERLRREEEERRDLGPNIDAEGRRMGEPHAGAERYGPSDSRGGEGPRRAEAANTEREPHRERGSGEHSATSWVSVIYGWLAALGASLILSGIVGGIIGAILGTSRAAVGGSSGATQSGVAGLVGLLVTLLLAFLIGGYVAGRLASRQGAKHGLLVALLALVVTLILAIIGGLVGINLITNLSNVTLPGLPNDAPQNLGTIFTISGVLALLLPFIGGAIGGAWGASTGRRRP